ncbi:MAG: ribonuclease R [Proteobacteria bacterium]|nr:ribonuclease R [Pseudomonadota bacterium]
MSKKNIPPSQDPFLQREAQNYATPIPSREYILSVLTEIGEPVKRRLLLKQFDLDTPELREALRRRLKAMVRDGQLFKSPEGYIPITHPDTCIGVVVIEKEGVGYVKTHDGQTIQLSGLALKGFYDSDEVEVQIIQVDKEGYTRGRIMALRQASTPMVVGRLLKSHQQHQLLPFDRKYSQPIIVIELNGAKEGDIVQVQILRDRKVQEKDVAKVTEVLGDFSTPGIEVNMAIRKFNLPVVWPKSVEKECKKFKPPLAKSKDKRKDLTDLPLVTIDGEDAKDFDDAVYCQETTAGWQLWVAIADVSYYVQPGSALDTEALRRGNSTYFPGTVIPMLPEALSNDLCSLKPNVPRLCVVCQMRITKTGAISSYTFYRATMHSKARLTYTEVNEILHGNQDLRERYYNLVTPLETLHALYQALCKQRKRRGAIDFDTLETQILFDKGGKIKSIIPRSRNIAHKMIEESMLAANVCAAKFLEKHKIPTLYRIHDRPVQDKLKSLREFLAELGLDLSGQKQPMAKDFSRLINKIQSRQDRHMIETVLLRSLSQAQYHPKNIGHFGLAYPCYLHFTSPIRRYPDLIVHRGIIASLHAKGKKQTIDYEKLGLHCSQTERRSDDATRDATLALKCHYMQDKVGQIFQGIVSGVASFGIFIELKDIYVEGLVHVTSLGNEYFHYDSTHHRMVGDRTRTIYRLGDSVQVQIMRVDIETKRIDLGLVNEKSKSKSNAKRKKVAKPHAKKPKKGKINKTPKQQKTKRKKK